MENKKILARRCMGCNKSKDKSELLRIVKSSEGTIQIDLIGKKNGRGAYICKDIVCLERVIKSKRLEKIFKKEIDNDIYEKLRGVIIDK